eukprot:100180-Chlamydomonas_euryale.AAC.1
MCVWEGGALELQGTSHTRIGCCELKQGSTVVRLPPTSVSTHPSRPTPPHLHTSLPVPTQCPPTPPHIHTSPHAHLVGRHELQAVHAVGAACIVKAVNAAGREHDRVASGHLDGGAVAISDPGAGEHEERLVRRSVDVQRRLMPRLEDLGGWPEGWRAEDGKDAGWREGSLDNQHACSGVSCHGGLGSEGARGPEAGTGA